MTEATPDERWMDRALGEALKGHPSPNPHVGALVVKDGALVGVGHHERAGGAHAEVVALRQAGPSSQGGTLYCTLEPCNHYGRTPPCTDAIIAAGIRRVVIGCTDPANHVPGGLEKMRANGIEVRVGVREHASNRVIADFSRHIRTGLPYIVLKAAVTLDGRIATRGGASKWITSDAARTEAHRQRDRADAVVVGVGTLIADDPALTVRRVPGRSPPRVVLDSTLRTPVTARIFEDPAEVRIYHGPDALPARRRALSAAGAALVQVAHRDGLLDLDEVFRDLGGQGWMRVLVEGGGRLHGSLLARRAAQWASIFVAPMILGDREALPVADAGRLDSMAKAYRIHRPDVRLLPPDILIEGELAYPDRERSAEGGAEGNRSPT